MKIKVLRKKERKIGLEGNNREDKTNKRDDNKATIKDGKDKTKDNITNNGKDSSEKSKTTKSK